MHANDLNSTTADIDLAVSDKGPLAWVLGELRKSLDGSVKALKQFVREAESAKGYDLATLDASQLRIERKKLQQAVGVLEMMALTGPVLVLRAMEAVFQKFNQQPNQCSPDATGKIEHAGFAVVEYLEGVLADKPASPVSLFPQYRQLQELVKADRIHPADLWPMEWLWLEPVLSAKSEPRHYDAPSRVIFDQLVLQVMKGQAPLAAADLKNLSLGFSAHHQRRQADLQPRIFWKLAAAYFEALELGLLPSDMYVRRASSRVLLQYASLSQGNTAVSDRLAQDLLFFCSQASVPATSAPVLAAVCAAYDLARFKAVDYEAMLFGRFDPALLEQARRRIVSAKETWFALLAEDTHKVKVPVDQFRLMTDSLVKLHLPCEPLAQALTRAVDAASRSGQPPTIELAMDVATSVLYLEAAFDHLDPTDGQFAERTQHLAERLERVKNGDVAQPLEPWMEDLYRRASDKQTMGSVVSELRTSIGELEKSLGIFLRRPKDKMVLINVPGQLAHMRGVLSVLGQDHASHAVLRMRDTIEQILETETETETDEEHARAAGIFEQLSNNLDALSFLIDMLNYQPALAKKLFLYDNVTGELRPLMGRTEKTYNAAPVIDAPAAVSGDDAQASANAPNTLAAAVKPAVGSLASPVEALDFAVDFDSFPVISGVPDAATVALTATTAGLSELEALQKQFEEFEALSLSAETFKLFDSTATVDEEQTKMIGNLRINIALYNVYLNEADEWSRRLLVEVSEWAMERSLPIGDSVVSFAHSLAASSATVGFNSLSEIARALEDALQLAQTHDSDAASARYADVFVKTAEDIRRLLHQFAAGFLKESDPVLLRQLRSLAFPSANA